MSSQMAQEKTTGIDDSIFSYSVRTNLRNKIETLHNGTVNILQLAHELHAIHGEYATACYKPFLDFLSDNQPSSDEYPKNDFDNWLKISREYVDQPTQPKPDKIHGRIFLSALILSEYPKVNRMIENHAEWKKVSQNLFNELGNEIHSKHGADLRSILTPAGKQNLELLFQNEGDLEDLYNRDDMPTDTDLLSRDALSGYLAKRIRHIYRKTLNGAAYKNSFFIHVDGKWGSGKSTFLGFLKKHLRKKVDSEEPQNGEADEWIVAEFNAWQNQRLNPPWWYIIQTVYTAALNDLWEKDKGRAMKFWLKEKLWRLNTGRNFFVSALITLALFIGALSMGVASEKGLKENALFTTIAGLVSLGGFLWSVSNWLRTSLISGSGKSAREFIEESSKDPMRTLNKHYEKMIGRMKYPLAVFIDDLDRCNKEYGIQLLEGLQTIFKNAPVVYVIAADGKWLSTMYENNYSIFSAAVAQPGKSFGMIFMDKTFQLRVELPEISNSLKEQYWNHLLGLGKAQRQAELEKAKATANKEMEGLHTNKDLMKKAKSTNSPVVGQLIKEMALNKMSISQEDKFFENRLQGYLGLIDNNPRSMKRLINTLSIERALKLLGNNAEITDEELILWTILKMQYPLVGEYLWKYPGVLTNSANLPGKPATDLVDLFRESSVQNLLSYSVKGKKISLTERFLKQMKEG